MTMRGQDAADPLDDGRLHAGSPQTGSFRITESSHASTLLRPSQRDEPRRSTSEDHASDGPPPVLMKSETLSSIRVGSGSLALSDLKNVANSAARRWPGR